MAAAGYDAYLRSPAWEQAHTRYRSHRRWACGMCGTNRGVQLHHLTYERIGNEELDDLIALCSGCHQVVHAHHAEHPRLSLKAATFHAIKTYRSELEITRRKRALRTARRKQAKRAARPQTDWVERLGAKTIRIKPSTESPRNVGATGTS